MSYTSDLSPDAAGSAEEPVGRTLRALRKAAGLTGQQLGVRTGMSQAKISRIETGAVTAETADVERLGRALGVEGRALQQLIDHATRSHVQMTEWRLGVPGLAERQREIGELEADIRELRVFQPTVIIGLLQTSEYARAILTSFQNHLTHGGSGMPGVVSEAVSARVRRHETLADPRKSFRFVLTETVFSNRLTQPAVMLAQVERVREVARQQNVELRIVPTDAELTVPPYHGFELFDDRSVTIDLFNTPITSRVRSDIQLYRHVFDELEQLASDDVEPILDHYVGVYSGLLRGAGAG